MLAQALNGVLVGDIPSGTIYAGWCTETKAKVHS